MYCDKLRKQVLTSGTDPVVRTKEGAVAGIRKNGAYIFRGIKYADAERFHMPVRVHPWTGTRAATAYGYACPEAVTPIGPDAAFVPHYYVPQDENCQYVNIWTPVLNENAGKPVMVWMHGGGWNAGSAVEQMAYDGEELSRFGDVVVVSFNHRHGPLGALDLSSFGEEYAMSGYCALGDILALLEWVRDNIACFGGDPTNVTVFGQSGGVAKILYAMQCPAADGLFQKAAIDSGGIREQVVPEGWTHKGLSVRMGELTAGCLGLTKETIREIETIPYWDLADAVQEAQELLRKESGLNAPYRWEPVPDGHFVVGSTLRDGFRTETAGIPMLIGNVFGEMNSNMSSFDENGGKNRWSNEEVRRRLKDRFGEGTDEILSAFREAYPEKNPADLLFIDTKERDGQLGLVLQRAEIGGDVWNWLFTKESPFGGGTVAWHCSELPYIFRNSSYIDAAYDPGVSERLEDIMSTAWVQFARCGDPNDGRLVPHWDRVKADSPVQTAAAEDFQPANFRQKDSRAAASPVQTAAAGDGTEWSSTVPTMLFDDTCTQRTGHDARLRRLLR